METSLTRGVGNNASARDRRSRRRDDDRRDFRSPDLPGRSQPPCPVAPQEKLQLVVQLEQLPRVPILYVAGVIGVPGERQDINLQVAPP